MKSIMRLCRGSLCALNEIRPRHHSDHNRSFDKIAPLDIQPEVFEPSVVRTECRINRAGSSANASRQGRSRCPNVWTNSRVADYKRSDHTST
jgi:hypothetical protein